MRDQPEPTEQEDEQIDELPEHQSMQGPEHDDPTLPVDGGREDPADET